MNASDLSHMVQGPTFLSLTAWRQVSEPWLTKAITRPKSRGTSFGTALWHHVQRYCFNRISFAHAQLPSYLNTAEVLPAFAGTNLYARSSKLTILMLAGLNFVVKLSVAYKASGK